MVEAHCLARIVEVNGKTDSEEMLYELTVGEASLQVDQMASQMLLAVADLEGTQPFEAQVLNIMLLRDGVCAAGKICVTACCSLQTSGFGQLPARHEDFGPVLQLAGHEGLGGLRVLLCDARVKEASCLAASGVDGNRWMQKTGKPSSAVQQF